ncbi:PH domain-containing protein [Streptomonospora nanhaiensis]|uniref:PH domain-containing protein n=1 Tax=Streptomonospora nanhaiensis TaxID=1323731 RepID=UPI001C39128C|nr:PH domain-containing protein [Streptomonospora nanhaiensis]MBV2365055.1 PH domain-containing protein [Streptomonospora nanhaiensis]MBX9388276.1 PH domain-containing protein [Streptomonospora nanhaiensis]
MTGYTRTADDGWRRLSRVGLWAGCAAFAALLLGPGSVVAAVLAVSGVFLPWGALVLGGAVLVAALGTGADALRVHRTRYRVTEPRLEIRGGILVLAHRAIPRERIRSVDVAVPVWLRPFGVCKVTVGTGQGAGAEEISLEYVARAEGERLRRELLLRGAAPEAAEGAPAQAAEGVELARLRPRWFAFAPLGAAVPALGLGVIGGAYNVLSWFGERRAGRVAVAVFEFAVANPLVVVPGAVAVVLATGAVAASAAQVEAWWGYRLVREPDGTLLVRRGLVTSTSLSVEERRLRGVELREPAPMRWFGGARVKAVATGLGTDSKQKGGAQRSGLSPDMPRERALRLTADVLRAPSTPVAAPLRAHPRAALRLRLRRAATAALALGALAALGAAGAAALPWAWVPEVAWAAAGAGAAAAAAPVLAVWAVGSYRGLGHTLTPGYLVVRRGAVLRGTVALRRDGVIGWRISRSPFQRRLGLATVGATTAAGSGLYAVVDAEESAGLRVAAAAVPGLLDQFLAEPPRARRPEAGPEAGPRAAGPAGPAPAGARHPGFR